MKEEKLLREKSKVIGKHQRTHNSLITGVDNPISLNSTYYILESGEIACKFTTNKFHQGHDNLVHGGIISAVLDEAMGRTNQVFGAGVTEPFRSVVTGEYKVKFLKPVPTYKEVYCFAKKVKEDGRKNYCEAYLVDEENSIYAKATGIFISIPCIDDMSTVSDIPNNSIYINENDPKEL